MRVLVFANTPAHVHLYRHAVQQLESAGHEVEILARDYGCTLDLLEYHGLPYRTYGACEANVRSVLARLPGHYWRIQRAVREFDPDIMFGVGAYAAHASAIARCPCILIFDSEPTSLDHYVSRPFVDAMLTPASFRKRLGGKHYLFDGFKEAAYLHPSVFSPDESIRADLGLEPTESFVFVRFNAFGSHHDIGHSGFPPARRSELVHRLAEEAAVIVSDESGSFDIDAHPARRYDLHPARLHDVLAAATLLVADTQTMVTESALLGTPAVRSNSFVGEDDMGNFLDLEAAGLIENAASFDDALAAAVRLAGDRESAATWQLRRDAILEQFDDLTGIIVEVATADEPVSALSELARPASTADPRMTGSYGHQA